MIACIVILLLLLPISPILWWIYKVITYNYKKNHQYLMFNQIEKGDYVWQLVGDRIQPFEVTSVSYNFDENNNITRIRIKFDLGGFITILPDSARTFKIEMVEGEYYTIFEHAEAKRLFTEIKRMKSRNDLLTNADEDVKIAIDKELKNIEKMKNELKEFKKKMS